MSLSATRAGVAAILLGLGICAAACKTSPTDRSAGASSASSTTAGSIVAPPSSAAGTSSSPFANLPPVPSGAVVPQLANLPFGERFSMEAKARPTGILTVENVYAALNKAGLPVTEQAQHLASPFGARYCVGAKISDGKEPQADVSVCEYSTEDAAVAGSQRSLEGFKMIPLRTVTRNKQTTLTLREYSKTPEHDALIAKATATFQKLSSPTPSP